jgi:hypothetical protein
MWTKRTGTPIYVPKELIFVDVVHRLFLQEIYLCGYAKVAIPLSLGMEFCYLFLIVFELYLRVLLQCTKNSKPKNNIHIHLDRCALKNLNPTGF